LRNMPLDRTAQRDLVKATIPERGNQSYGAPGEEPSFGWHAFSR